MRKTISLVDSGKRRKIAPMQLDLTSPSGRALVLKTAKRVIHTHRKVLEALAKR